MPTYTLRGRITDDHRLEVEVPPDAPAGEAEVVVTVERAGEGTPKRGSGEALLALARKWEKSPLSRPSRSKKQIDAEIRDLRDEWDQD
jgi:hypothetical protein